MRNSLFTYFNSDTSDAVSVSELEYLVQLNPADIIPKLLLTNKMKQNDTQELMLHFNDRTALQYLRSGDTIPSIRDLDGIILVEHTKELADNVSMNYPEKPETLNEKVLEKPEPKPDDVEEIDEQDSDSKVILENEYPAGINDILSNELLDQKDSDIRAEIGNMDDNNDVSDSSIATEVNEHSPLSLEINDETAEEQGSKDDLANIESKAEQNIIDAEMKALPKAKKSKKKSAKSKKNKYKLAEFSGISPFSKWLLTFKKADIDKKIKKEEKLAKRKAIEATANKSIEKSAAIISEPLADLLASQGHFDDAKKMYEQLMMKYPEKSSYFAAKINQNIKY